MGAVKQWAWDEAEKKVDTILQKYVDLEIKYDDAKAQILAVDNLDLVDIDEHSVDEVMHDFWNDTMNDRKNNLK